MHQVSVVVPMPAHSALGDALSYTAPSPLPPGRLVRVPLGSRQVLGVVWADADREETAPVDPSRLKPVVEVLDDIPPLGAHWCRLIEFAARYYQRAVGEVALAALPPALRELDAVRLARRLARKRPAPALSGTASAEDSLNPAATAPSLTAEQHAALDTWSNAKGTYLLWGATGSGKTEVYLQAAERALQEPGAQVLVMVPEINLTPQLQARFEARFQPLFGAHAVVSLHSGMTPAQRLQSWLAAHLGRARVVLGTRMAVFASMPGLRLIAVDEEHDPSYKAQDGARHSARDLAVYRGKQEGVGVVLGSATPSLESWLAAERGRYRRLDMPTRVGAAALPQVRLVDMRLQPHGAALAPSLVAALSERVARGEQALVLLNRRGYAPVLACGACEWKSDCPNCSAYRVFHRSDRSLRCHHCGLAERVPRACPECGNVDIAPVGRGTERLEEQLTSLLADVRGPSGEPVRIGRIDADTTRAAGALQAQLAQVHAGEVDVLVGTQMIAKGHDFRRVTLVAVPQADNALFASDFRAPERLFALLMQAGGRAGRDAGFSAGAELWLQTHNPTHPLFVALRRHDFAAFAQQELAERERAGLPPYVHQALLRADARSQDQAQQFLRDAAELAADLAAAHRVQMYSPVPLSLQRVANVERAQLLVEASSRARLQAYLAAWRQRFSALRPKGLIRWMVDVDPQSI